MPVLAQTRRGLEQWDAKRYQNAIAGRFALCTEPTYRNDPTYNLRRKPKP